MEYVEIKYANASEAALFKKQTPQENSYQDQFLMKSQPEYENVRSDLTGRVPSPSLDDCLNELVRDEKRQLTQAALTQQATSDFLEVAYGASGNSQPPAGPAEVSNAAKGQIPDGT